jgi:mannose-6-phosphate isomerase-like protein (cupin superfamily)
VIDPVRRIVTAIDSEGRSYFAEDGASPAILTVPTRPGYCVTNLWQTSESPAPICAADSAAAIRGTAPPKRGTVMRTIDIPPEAKDPEERRRNAEATFKAIFNDLHRPPSNGLHPAYHTTDSIDYAIVLSGEIYALMDRGETLMRAGDVLIQRGTPHAWSNRGEQVCRILFILIDAQR